MFDLLIRGAEIINADGHQYSDVAISHGRIAELIRPGADVAALRTIDATGLWLMPGLVDAHVHLREPGLVHKEGFETGTRAAAAGGVTTVMVMPTDKPITMTPEQFCEKRALGEGKAHVDFALQAVVGVDTHHVRALTDLGAISFEIFMADVANDFLVRELDGLLAALQAIAACGRVAGLTPGDHDVVTARTAAVRNNKPARWKDVAAARPPVSEALGVAKGCVAARESSASVHFRQISCEMAVEVLNAFRPQINMSAEVTPHNLLLDETEPERQGAIAKVAPPLRPMSDVISVRRGLQERVIDMVATDHAPHLPEEKGAQDIWAAPGGFPGLQSFLPAMLRCAELGLLSMTDLVRTCSAAPARRFGLYPRKGVIQAHSDADMILIAPHRRSLIRNDDQYSKARVTPFAGLECQGLPVKVFLRGQEIMSDGRVDGLATGKFLKPST